ncbi:low molecular weight phosphatase family protein [Streptomyces sp. NPDC085614]|uniref:arsenate reductase/protein-tyrosine-phosphatase family protein n=1 Tax=Streptomyces sp. NPDC085614 TaxID=3365733 RepID=UPI0037D85E2F
MTGEPGPDTTVLFVCTGNTYRSPLAERLLAARLGPDSPVRVSSAGTRAAAGDRMDPATRSVLTELGVTGTGFRPRPLTTEMVTRASLVLGMEGEHREAAVRLVPLALRRCFTLREFVRLAEGHRPEGSDPGPGPGRADVPDLVARAAARRGTVAPPGPGADAVPDPCGEPYDVLRRCAEDIDALAVRLAALLSAVRAPAARL